MILSDRALKHALGVPGDVLGNYPFHFGSLKIDPLLDAEVQIQPASVDLRLGAGFVRFDSNVTRRPKVVYADSPNGNGHAFEVDTQQVGRPYFEIGPGEFVLGHTLERVKLPANLAASVDGRSSIGRLGVTIHITAGYIDPGFEGQITLEIFNASPNTVRIPIGMRVCQLVVYLMTDAAADPYGSAARGSKYQHQEGATRARTPATKP